MFHELTILCCMQKRTKNVFLALYTGVHKQGNTMAVYMVPWCSHIYARQYILRGAHVPYLQMLMAITNGVETTFRTAMFVGGDMLACEYDITIRGIKINMSADRNIIGILG